MLVFARICVGIRAKDRRPHGSIKGEELQEICTQRLEVSWEREGPEWLQA